MTNKSISIEVGEQSFLISIAEGEMVNLNQLHIASGKNRSQSPNFWLNQKATTQLIEKLKESLNASDFNIIKTRNGKGGGTYAHWQIALAYTEYLNTANERHNMKEKHIQKQFTSNNPKYEVETPVGYADILTDTEIIEVKNIKSWKSAIGQILVYGYYFPKKKKRIHLFGKCSKETRKIIIKHCDLLKIKVTFEQ